MYRYDFTGGESFPLVKPTDVRRRGTTSFGRRHDEVATAVRTGCQSTPGRRATFGPRRPSSPPSHADEGFRFRRRVLVHQMRQNVPDVARPGGAFQEVSQREETVLLRVVQQIFRSRDKPKPTPVSRVSSVLLYFYPVFTMLYAHCVILSRHTLTTEYSSRIRRYHETWPASKSVGGRELKIIKKNVTRLHYILIC